MIRACISLLGGLLIGVAVSLSVLGVGAEPIHTPTSFLPVEKGEEMIIKLEALTITLMEETDKINRITSRL